MLNRLNQYFGFYAEQAPAVTDTFKPHPSWAKINQEKREEHERLERRDQQGNTPLIQAIIACDLDSVESWLDAGADINNRGYLGYTPLAVAAYYGFFDIASELIKRGAILDLLTTGTPAFSPLTIAMRFSRSEEIVRLLILSGANIQRPDGSGCTPLMTAAACKQHGMVGMLLQSGANPAATDQYGNTAAMYALNAGCVDIVELLQMDARSIAHMDFSLPQKNNVLLANLPVKKPTVTSTMQTQDDLQARKDKFFEDFLDPVTLEIIETPHVSKYGFVYDKSTMESLFAKGATSVREPVSNAPTHLLDRGELDRQPCVLLQNLLKKRHAEWLALLQKEQQAEAALNEPQAMDITPPAVNDNQDESAKSSPVVSDSEQARVKRRLFFEKPATAKHMLNLGEQSELKKMKKV